MTSERVLQIILREIEFYNLKQLRWLAAEVAKRREQLKDESVSKPEPEKFAEIVNWWNAMKREGLVAAGTTVDTEANWKAWRRIYKDVRLRRLFDDLYAIEIQIKGASSVLKCAGWFTLPKLLGAKNKEGELIVDRILECGYLDQKKDSFGRKRDAANYDPADKTRPSGRC